MTGRVVAVATSGGHTFSKSVAPSIELIAGIGISGDAHAGVTVKHRSRVAQDPTQPNLRQVHLLQEELFDELRVLGFNLSAGAIGENILTRDLDLLSLPEGAELHIGPAAVVSLTGLRNPCSQLDGYQAGLMAATLGRDEAGELVRKTGVMGIVLADGTVEPGQAIGVLLPPLPHRRLHRV